MATTGIVKGKDFLLYVGGTAVTYSTACSLSLVMDTLPTNNKDDGGWASNLESIRSWSGSTDALLALDATYGIEDIYGVINSRASVTVKFATSDATDRFFSGTARITGLDPSADNEAVSNYSLSFVGTGKLKYAAT